MPGIEYDEDFIVGGQWLEWSVSVMTGDNRSLGRAKY